MKATELVYMGDMHRLNDTATVLNITSEGQKSVVVLDRTIFYPQGGGQPADRGAIEVDQGVFNVDDVRFADGVVYHKGVFAQGAFQAGDRARLAVDSQRRLLNSRLHTAGHLIDYAVNDLGLKLVASKGHHFSESPYVEYEGLIDAQRKEELENLLEPAVNRIIARSLFVDVKIVPYEQLKSLCDNMPTCIPVDKPVRVMTVEGYSGIPCGGTHVALTSQVGQLMIASVKNKGGNTRVSYRLTV